MTQLIATNQLTLTNVIDGRTPYVHWAYSDNADGTGLTLTDNGQRYMGYYTDYTQADSTDKTKYTWTDRWAKIDIGGTNQISLTGASVGYMVGVSGENVPDSLHTVTKFIPVKYSNYVLSYDGELDNNPNYYYSLAWYSTPDISGFISRPTGSAEQTDLINGKKLTPPANATYLRVSFPTNFYKVMLNGGTVKLNWSKSPEDIQADIDSKADQALTKEQLNALNEKNQILEAELQAKASVDSLSEFEKAYQAFVKSNAEGRAKAEADLIEAGRRIELLTTQFGGLAELKTFIDTYMSSSNEGFVIGKNDASSTIKVSSDRISMFSAGKEVMYISQGVIHIDNGIFTKSLQIGRFRTEQYGLNTDINVIRYVR